MSRSVYQGTHQRLPSGQCLHRWRNRQTRPVDCLWAEGYEAATREFRAIQAEARALSPERLRAARFVAESWRDAVMASEALRRTGMSHPLAMVLAALDGETDPRQLGLDESQDEAFRAAVDAPTRGGGRP